MLWRTDLYQDLNSDIRCAWKKIEQAEKDLLSVSVAKIDGLARNFWATLF